MARADTVAPYASLACELFPINQHVVAFCSIRPSCVVVFDSLGGCIRVSRSQKWGEEVVYAGVRRDGDSVSDEKEKEEAQAAGTQAPSEECESKSVREKATARTRDGEGAR